MRERERERQRQRQRKRERERDRETVRQRDRDRDKRGGCCVESHCGEAFFTKPAKRVKRTESRRSTAEKTWVSHHESVRSKENLRRDIPPWIREEDVQLTPMTDRVRDLINLAWEFAITKYPEKASSELQKELWVDTSQSGHWQPWSFGTLRAITTGSDFYSFARRRWLHPLEVFAIMGFDPKTMRVAGMSPNHLRDLVGEAMALPAVGAVALCLSHALPSVWEAEEDGGSDS